MEQYADGRYGPWVLVEGSSPTLFDGGDPNSNTNVLFVNERTPGSPIVAQCGFVKAINREVGATNFGIAVRISKDTWKAGQWTHGTTTYTEDTIDAQSTATGDFPLETTTNNSGIVVQSYNKFNALSIKVSTASVGSPARIIEYSVAGGGWTTITRFINAPPTAGNYAVGENIYWWATPTDWAPIEAGHGTNLTVGMRGIRVRSTTAPATTAGVATSLSVHRVFAPSMTLAQYAEYKVDFGALYAPLTLDGDAILLANSVSSTGHPCTMLLRSRG